MDDLMTITEIYSRFPSEWVLVEDPQVDDSLAVRGGRVRHHSKDCDEVYRRAVEMRLKRFAVLYTGTIPEDTEIILHTSPVVIENCAETGLYVGYVPGLPGAHTQAETLNELDANLREVLELLSGEGEPAAA